MRIAYWSPARDEVGDRLVLPRQVFTDRGEWYLTADDDRSGQIRIFRIDRIGEHAPTGQHPTPLDQPLPVPGEWFTDGAFPRVTLRLAPSARWVVERYPFDEVGEPDANGCVIATLAVVSEPWFTRTLVRLGADCEVVSPVEWGDRARAATERVLDRYRRS
mgnify:FL=1